MARILVVDDAAMTRTMLRSILEKAGHGVDEAADGDAAMALFRDQSFDLAFVDIFMPGKEGLATIRDMLEHRPGFPIVAMSAGSTFTDTETLGWAKSYGASFALPKPLNADAVLETVRQALGGRA